MKVTCCPSAALSDFNLSNSQASMTSDSKSCQVNYTGITQIRGNIDDKTPDPDFISIGGIMFRTLNSSADLNLELSVVLMLTNDSAGRLACVSGKARATILHLHPHRRRGWGFTYSRRLRACAGNWFFRQATLLSLLVVLGGGDEGVLGIEQGCWRGGGGGRQSLMLSS